MPTISIDENSLKMLKNTKDIMKQNGESASYSDAIRHLAKSTVNLCRTCVNDFPSCKNSDPCYGTGIGNDNVYDCNKYVFLKGPAKW